MLVDTISKVNNITFDSTNLNAYVTSLRGLSETQARVVLSSTSLDKVQKQQILNKLAETNATVSLTSAEATEALTRSLGSKEAANELLVKSGLVTEEQLLAGSTIEVTSAKIADAVATGVLTKEEGLKISTAFGLTGANIGLGTSFKLLALQIWESVKAMAVWLVTTPTGWATLIIGSIAGAIAAYIKWGDTVENATEKLEESKQAYQEVKSELESVNSELKTTQDRISELEGKDTLTLTEKEELDNLKKQNNELEYQNDLLEEQNRIKNKEKNRDFVHLMDKKSEGSTYITDENGNQVELTGKDKKKYWDDFNITNYLSAKARHDEGAIDTYEKQMMERWEEYEENIEGVEYIPKPTNDDERAVNEWLDFAYDYRDRMMIALGGDGAKESAFNRVVDNWQFDEVTQKLQDLGKEGKVTAEMLNDPKYDAFIQKLIDIEFISDDTEGSLRFVASAFNGTMQSAQKYVTSLKGNEINNFINNLNNEAKALGATESELAKLTAAHVIFNNTGLSTEQQQQALQMLAAKIATTSAEMKYLLQLFNYASGNFDAVGASTMTEQERRARNVRSKQYLKDKYGIDLSPIKIPEKDVPANSSTGSDSKSSSSSDAEEAKKAEEERIKKENEAFKAGLEARQKLLERYEESIGSIDFGLDMAEENDFALRADLLNNKMSQITAYGEAMRQEFDRVASIIPQTGEEAEALASHLESLGSDMRDNIKNLRETQIAMEQLKIDSITSIGDYYLGDLESELSNIEKRIELLNKDNKDDYKYTNEILQMKMFLPTRSNFGARLKGRSSADREIIESEQATQDAINDIIETQIQKNESLREEERQQILAGMEELRNNTQIKIDEVQEYYNTSLKTNEENTKTAWQNMTNTVDTAISNTTEKFSAFDDVVGDLNTKAKTLYDNLSKISKITGGATSDTDGSSSTNGMGGSGKGGGASDALQEYQDNIEEWIDKHNYEFYDGEVSKHGYSDPFQPGYAITSRPGGRTSPVGKGDEFHTGLDIGATLGTKIYSTSGGTVTLSGVNGGYGNCVVIRDDKGYTWLYGHMAEPSKLKVGDKVRRGQMVGLVGSTGWSTGPHLHLEMRDPNNAVVDPSPYLPNYAKGTPRGNSQAGRLGIAGENFKPELLIDKLTGKISYIDKPTVIDLSKTDVVGERATANLPKFADGTISPDDIASYIRQNYPEITDAGIAALLGNIAVESGFNSKASVNEIVGGGNNNLTTRSGLFQANDDRIPGWNDIVNNGTWQQQIDAVLDEAKSGSGIGYNAYENILTNTGLGASDAAKLWDEKWERSDGSARNLRATNAEKYYEQIQDNTLALDRNTSAIEDEGNKDKEKENEWTKKINEIVGSAVGEIDKASFYAREQQLSIMTNDELSDEEKKKLLFGVYQQTADTSGRMSRDAYKELRDFLDYYYEVVPEEEWSQEVIDAAYEGLESIESSAYETANGLADLRSDMIGDMEDDLAELDQYIADRNFFGDWELFGDSEAEAIQRQIDTIVEAYKAGALSPEEYNKLISQYEQALYTSMKTTLVDSLDLAISKIGSMKTLLQSHFDVTNSITNAQYELNKELSASKTMYEYLNEDTRKLLFNQEDYNVLSEELLDIQDRANDLQEDYNREIRGATSENLDEITSKYQMQYDLLMKSYEIKKADLEILKKQQKLNNVLNERNVRMFINGQWRWVAKTQDVIDAQNELADAKFAQEQASQSALQTEKLNNLTKAEDTLTTTINNVENGIVNFDNQVGEISKVLKGIETTELPGLKNIIGSAVTSLGVFVKGIQMAKIDTAISYSKNLDYATLLTNSAYTDSGKEYINQDKRNQKVAGEGLTYTAFGDIDGNHHDPIANEYEKNDYWSDVQNSIAKGDYAGAIEANNKRNEKIDYLGLGVEKYSDDDIKDMVYVAHKLAKGGYAKGTGSATPGFSQMGEKGDELFINSHGHLIPINRPTFTNMHGGEIVFNQDQMNFARNLWECSNTGITDFGGLINKSLPQTIDNSNCNNVIINGMTVDSGSADGQALISALRRYVNTH